MTTRNMPRMQKSPTALVEAFQQLIPDDPEIERRQLFGYPAVFVNGNMFAGLFQDSMTLRLPESDRAVFLKQKGAKVFEPMPGRPMREYVVVPDWMLREEEPLSGYLDRARAYAASLAPKSKARKPGKRAKKN